MAGIEAERGERTWAAHYRAPGLHGRRIACFGGQGIRGFFPLAFTGICQGELDEIRDHLPDYENDDTQTLAISVGASPSHKIWAMESGFTFPVLSDFWPHGVVSQAYGVFNSDAGFANRGTFVVDRSGVIRFAEMKQPGEPRDLGMWTDALTALKA